jgi:hypothetical protein
MLDFVVAQTDIFAFVPDAFDRGDVLLWVFDGKNEFATLAKFIATSGRRNAKFTDGAENCAALVVAHGGEDDRAHVIFGGAFHHAVPGNFSGDGDGGGLDALFFAEGDDAGVIGFEQLHCDCGAPALLLSGGDVVVAFNRRPTSCTLLKKRHNTHGLPILNLILLILFYRICGQRWRGYGDVGGGSSDTDCHCGECHRLIKLPTAVFSDLIRSHRDNEIGIFRPG